MSNHKRLSIEELRSFPGFENCTDEVAEETISSVETLSILLYELNQKALLEVIDQKVIGTATGER
ncbi:MAG: hypothetical protein ACT4ON_00920 [Bacteroidota bacterium]